MKEKKEKKEKEVEVMQHKEQFEQQEKKMRMECSGCLLMHQVPANHAIIYNWPKCGHKYFNSCLKEYLANNYNNYKTFIT